MWQDLGGSPDTLLQKWRYPLAPTEIYSALSTLTSLDEGALYGELGLRLKSIAQRPQLSSDFGLRLAPEIAETMGLREDFGDFGKKFFERVSSQAYGLLCGSDPAEREDRARLKNTFDLGEDSVAATLTGLFVAQLGLAPAVAPVVALLIIRLFFRPALDSMCEVWQAKLKHS